MNPARQGRGSVFRSSGLVRIRSMRLFHALLCAAAVFAFLAFRFSATDNSQNRLWEILPRDLPSRLGQLFELSLPRAVKDVAWLTPPLQTLSLHNSSIRNLDSLPDSLEELDVEDAADVRRLPNLPRLRYLDIRGAPVEDLTNLPAGLKSLKISGAQFKALPHLPDTLSDLAVVDTAIRQIGDLPSSLRSLLLQGGKIEAVENLPPELHSLTLINTSLHRLPALPASLQTLAVSLNPRLIVEGLPTFLVRLEVDQDRMPLRSCGSGSTRQAGCSENGTGPALTFLKTLIVSQAQVPPEIPRSVSSLELDDIAALPKAWPPHLRDLGLTNLRPGPLPRLPDSLESLNLTGYEVGGRISLPPGLRRLKLVCRDLRQLKTILPAPASLEDLDLTGSPIPSLEPLQSMPHLVRLRVGDSLIREITWLPESLEELAASDIPSLSSISIKSWPRNLRILDLARTSLRELPSLPPQLRELDISNTRIRSLAALRNLRNLEALTLSAEQVATLADMPRTVTRLYFVEKLPARRP
jgi:hypothetical protein